MIHVVKTKTPQKPLCSLPILQLELQVNFNYPVIHQYSFKMLN